MKWKIVTTEDERPTFESTLRFIQMKYPEASFDFGTEWSHADQEVYSGARFSTRHMQFKIEQQSEENFVIGALRARDCVQLLGSGWQSSNDLAHSFNRLIAHSGLSLDLKGGVLLLGANEASLSALYGLTKVGFKKVAIIDSDDASSEAKAHEIKKQLFGLQVSAVPVSMITQLAGVYSMVFNALEADGEKLIEEELCYFNFLSPGGIIFDVKMNPNSLFLSEARKVKAMVKAGEELLWARELIWYERIFKETCSTADFLNARSRP